MCIRARRRRVCTPRTATVAYPDHANHSLGYSIMAPFIGYVDGVHPRRVLEAAALAHVPPDLC